MRPERLIIAKAWQSYRDAVVPSNASQEQLNETRQAFYGGASILFYAIMQSLDSDDEPTDADMQFLTDLQTEIDTFGQEVDLRFLPAGPRH